MRRGYTLFELIVTVALILAISAMAWPSFRSRLERGRLESAGREMGALVRETRRLAMSDSIPYRLDVAWNTGSYRIVPASDSLDSEMFDESAATPNTPIGPARPGQAEEFRPTRRAGTLYPGLRFQNPDAWESSPLDAPALEQDRFAEEGDAMDGAEVEWSSWLVGFPGGQLVDARIRIVDRNGRWVEILVAGLMAQIEVSGVRQPERSDEELVRSAEWDGN